MSESPGSGGGRYQRTTNGLIGALLISLLAIAAFVAFRALTRDELDVEPAAVDYLGQVAAVQEAGFEVAYPAQLPEGWRTTSVEARPGERPSWSLGMLTEDQQYVGIRQEDESLEDLLETYVDEETEGLPAVRTPGSVAETWQVYADDGGDLGYVAQVGEQTVLVYGSAGAADLEELLERLTTDPVG